MINAGTVSVKLFADVKQFQAGMAGASASVGKMTKGIQNFAKMSIFAFAAITAASAKMATDFDKRLREISTLIIGVTEKDIKNMSREIRDLANLTGKALDDLGKAKYDIISAGFTGVAESAQLLNTSARLAVGGVTSVTNAADLLTSALNSWQQSGLEAEKAADILFTTVRLGKTTMDELVGSVGRVFPTAKTLGASLADVGAAMATITAGGIKTYEAATYLNQAFTKLGAPSDSAAKAMKRYGVGVKVADDGMFDLLATIKQFQGYDLQQMRKFFPEIRAIKAVLAMSNNMKFLERAIRDTGNAAGATQTAFGKMSKSWSTQLNRNVMQLKDIMINLGDKIMPTVVDEFDKLVKNITDSDMDKFAETVKDIAKSFGEIASFIKKNGKMIMKAIVALSAIGITSGVIKNVTKAYKALFAIITKIIPIVSTFGSVLAAAFMTGNPVVAAITVTIVGIIAAIDNFLKKKKLFDKSYDDMQKKIVEMREPEKAKRIAVKNSKIVSLNKEEISKGWGLILEGYKKEQEKNSLGAAIYRDLQNGFTKMPKLDIPIEVNFDYGDNDENLKQQFKVMENGLKFDLPKTNWGDKLIENLDMDDFENQINRMKEIFDITPFDANKNMFDMFNVDFSPIEKLDGWFKILKIDWDDLTAQQLSGVFNIDTDTLQEAGDKIYEMTGKTFPEFIKMMLEVKDTDKTFDGLISDIRMLDSLTSQGLDFKLPMLKTFGIDTSSIENVVEMLKKYNMSWEQIIKTGKYSEGQIGAIKLALDFLNSEGYDTEKLAEYFNIMQKGLLNTKTFANELASSFSSIGNSISSTMADSFAEIVLSGRVAMQELEKYNKGLTNDFRTKAEIQEDAWANMWNNILVNTISMVAEMAIQFALLAAALIVANIATGGMLAGFLSGTEAIKGASKFAEFLFDLFGGENASGMVKGIAGFLDDGVITPSGQVVHTAPDDYIMAMKDPASFGKNAGGGGDIYNVTLQMMDATDVEGLINRHKQPFAKGIGTLINNRNLVVKTSGQNARASY